MPSWNIHIAQAERVFARHGALARVVVDRNAFLLGCLVPDIYVGYMVPQIEHPIAYRITHFATPAHIPKPREAEFFEAYVVPAARRLGAAMPAEASTSGDSTCGDSMCGARLVDAVAGTGSSCGIAEPILPASLAAEADRVSRVHYPQRFEGVPEPPAPGCPEDADVSEGAVARSVFDLVLGCWLHLVADNLWNTRVNEFLDAHGDRPSEGFRIKKQGDFDRFGRALSIDALPRVTPRLIAAAAAFPQYPIEEDALRATVGVAHEIVRTNHGDQNPVYQLLNSDFFEHVFAESVELPGRLLEERW